MSNVLLERGYKTESVPSGEEALRRMARKPLPDLVLMDIELAGKLDGVAAALEIGERHDVPVVFLTAGATEETLEKIRNVTAYGYVLKDRDMAALLSTVDMALKLHEAKVRLKVREATLEAIMNNASDAIVLFDSEGRIFFWNPAAERLFGYSKEESLDRNFFELLVPAEDESGWLHAIKGEHVQIVNVAPSGLPSGRTVELKALCRDGSTVDIEVALSTFEVGSTRYNVGIARDISRRKQFEKELVKLSITDPLTGVYNRRHFERRIRDEIKKARLEGRDLSLVILDLDHFKSINDRFGHDKGDQVLKATTDLIREHLQGKGTLARWGGEEFVILLPGLSAGDAADLAETLREGINNMRFDGDAEITASFGVAGLAPDDTFDTLIKKADNMLYEAKANGRNRVRVAIEEMQNGSN
jgi:diguanylate cyclase (GGDEF)-like protein/PAS domain S-box-containing protein